MILAALKYADVVSSIALVMSTLMVIKTYRNEGAVRVKTLKEVSEAEHGSVVSCIEISLKNWSTIKASCKQIHVVARTNRRSGMFAKRKLLINSFFVQPSQKAIGVAKVSQLDASNASGAFIVPANDTFVDLIARDTVLEYVKKTIPTGPVYLRAVVTMTNGKVRRSWRTLKVSF